MYRRVVLRYNVLVTTEYICIDMECPPLNVPDEYSTCIYMYVH
jgi:hypothetical protein